MGRCAMGMTFNNLAAEANAKVKKWILNRYHENWSVRQGHPHLVDCPDAVVKDLDGENGIYGCDTGCEYARLTATIRCPHGYVDDDWGYGEFGDLAGILDEILGEEPHA